MNNETVTVPNPPERQATDVRNDWNALIAAFLGWTLDSFDYFVVVLVLTEIGASYQQSNAKMALALTLTLALRPLGAFVFGLAADRYGRRLPLLIDVIAYSILEVASGFAPNFTTFLVLRALFGIAMGGEWGVGASLAMESVPAKWRGLMSGFLQQGYALGYLLAAFAYYFVMPRYGWRAMFLMGGAPALLAIFIRSKVKESAVWKRSQRRDWSQLAQSVRGHLKYYALIALAVTAVGSLTRLPFLGTILGLISLFVGVMLASFMVDTMRTVAAGHHKLFLYLVIFMTFMGFASHGTQDMYPTFLKTQRHISPQLAAIITAIANVGAICGGIIVGLLSDRIGRRKSIIISFAFGILVIPLWAFAPTTGLLALGGFLLQFMVQGAWGIVPAYINELSPDHIRGFLPGFAYQCGMLLAGSVGYIEAVFAGHASYSTAMALTALFVFVAASIVAGLGRENHRIEFGKTS